MVIKIEKEDIKNITIFSIIIVIGLLFVYAGIFFIYYTTDKITSMENVESEELDYWEVDWETERPYVDLGLVLLFIGLAVLLIGIVMLLRQIKK
jgi:uncharacterized membrane protein